MIDRGMLVPFHKKKITVLREKGKGACNMCESTDIFHYLGLISSNFNHKKVYDFVFSVLAVSHMNNSLLPITLP